MVRITSKLNTSRLSLRPLASEDFPSLIELLSDFEVSRALRQVPHPYTQQDAEDFLRITIEGREANALDDYAITRHHDGSFIGGIGLRYNDERTRADVGYWIARKHWGCGYATEAVRAVIDFAFSERARHKELEHVEAHVHVGNERSRRVLTKCGFTETAIETIDACGHDGNRKAHKYERSRA